MRKSKKIGLSGKQYHSAFLYFRRIAHCRKSLPCNKGLS